jgi:integrase
MPRADYREGVAPTCECEDPWACKGRYPHRSWSWRITGAMYHPVTGKRIRPAGSGLPTQSAAKEALGDAKSDYRNKRKVLGGERYTLAELFEWWTPFKESHYPPHSANSLRNWKREARLWVDELGHIVGEDLQKPQIDAVLSKWAQPREAADRPKGFAGRWVPQLSPTTLDQRRSTLRNMINDARVAQRVPPNMVNPAEGEMPSIGLALGAAYPVRENIWTELVSVEKFEARWGPEETAAFLDSLIGHKWETLFTLYVYSAARRGEWLGARRDALRHDGLFVVGTCRIVTIEEREAGQGKCPVCGVQHKGRVIVPRDKTAAVKRKQSQAPRWIPLPDEAVGLLRNHLLRQEQQRREAGYVDHFLVFAEEDGSPIYPGSVTSEFERLIQAAGLPSIPFKDLRSNAASMWLAGGIDAEVVARTTGHNVAVLREHYWRTHPQLVGPIFQKVNDTMTRLRRSARPLQAVDLGSHASIVDGPHR